MPEHRPATIFDVRPYPGGDDAFTKRVQSCIENALDAWQVAECMEEALRTPYPRVRVVVQAALARDWPWIRRLYVYRDGSVLGSAERAKSVNAAA